MSIKEAMKKYFAKRKKMYSQGKDYLFKTPYNEDVSEIIYQGEIDEEEYISWVPVEKNITLTLNKLQTKFDVVFHPSINEYFNSYWFADLDGFINNHYITLEAVLPNIELESFKNLLQGYKNNHKDRLDHIPIGIEGNGLLVVVDNGTGKIMLEDFERGALIVISDSIAELILSFRLKR